MDDDQLDHIAFLVADGPATDSRNSRAARLAGCFEYHEAIIRMNLLKRGCFAQLGRGITQDSFVCGTVVETVPFHVYQRNHVSRIFRDDLK